MAKVVRHRHEPVRESGPFGYTQSVAVYPYTTENRAAHGCVEYVQHCSCGAVRSYLVNGRAKEWGVWRNN